MFHAISEAVARLKIQLFNNKLPPIRFQIDGSRSELFRFRRPNLIQIGAAITAPELNRKLLIDQLLHVLVHAHNAYQGVVDENINQYHNQEFSAAALAIGLAVCHTPNNGWSLTYSPLHPEFRNLVEDGKKVLVPKKEAARELRSICLRLEFDSAFFFDIRKVFEKSSIKRPSKLCQLKYVCGCDPPHNSIRSGRRPYGGHPLVAVCQLCGQKFVLAEQAGG